MLMIPVLKEGPKKVWGLTIFGTMNVPSPPSPLLTPSLPPLPFFPSPPVPPQSHRLPPPLFLVIDELFDWSSFTYHIITNANIFYIIALFINV